MSIYRSASGIYGEENFKKIVDSKILVVGAGGIGCEVSRLTGGIFTHIFTSFLDSEKLGFLWMSKH
jgi:hypothetical protein